MVLLTNPKKLCGNLDISLYKFLLNLVGMKTAWIWLEERDKLWKKLREKKVKSLGIIYLSVVSINHLFKNQVQLSWIQVKEAKSIIFLQWTSSNTLKTLKLHLILNQIKFKIFFIFALFRQKCYWRYLFVLLPKKYISQLKLN